jgi:hypothetical protein
MKKTTALMLISLATAAGQTGDSGEGIAIAVAIPHQNDPLNAAQLARLGKKMVAIATQSGMSAAGSGSEIIMYPEISVEGEELVEGGMQNLVVVAADVSFTIRHLESGKVFAAMSKRVTGAGVNRQSAISEAISKISADGEVQKFVAEGRTKIMDYYADNCKNIALKAESCARRHEYRQAIAMLAFIPEAVSCAAHAQRKLEDIFADYQAHRCEELLRQAKSLSAGRSYAKALAVLASIDNFSTPCAHNVNAMMADLESRISAEEQKEWRLMMQRLEDNQKKYSHEAEVKKAQINAIRDIATAYYSQKTELNYSLIVK